MQDPHALGAGGSTSLAGRVLERLAAVQWAGLDSGRAIRGVLLRSDTWAVVVGDQPTRDRFGPFSYEGDVDSVVGGLVRAAGLAAPRSGPAVPIYPEPGAPWRHFWAELLQDLGVHGYVLRDGGGTKRYESMELDAEHVASVSVVDEEGSRWISRIALDPPLVDVAGVPFDISNWIGSGQGQEVGDRTKVLELRH